MNRPALITFADACRLDWLPLRRKGSRLTVRTLVRWKVSGQHVNGRVIRLRARRVGSTWCTTEEWLDEHFAAVAEAEMAGPADAGTEPPGERITTEAAAILDAAGI